MNNNLLRMIALVNEFFDNKNDIDQISVSEEERVKLEAIHAYTMSELCNELGPIVWILVIPTTNDIMKKFLKSEISEKQVLDLTQPGDIYDSIYLCSAIVLTEFRKLGLAKKVTLEAVKNIIERYPIETLFYWSFSAEGTALANSIAKELNLPILNRN